MRISPLAAGLAVIAAAPMCVCAQRKLVIDVVDRSEGPPWVISAAAETARMAFRSAHIDTEWRISSGEDKTADIQIWVMPESKTRLFDDEAAGYAMPEGFPIPRAYAFYESVQKVSWRTLRSPNAVLGCIFVHEMGHLLGLKHEPGGAMRAFLDSPGIDAVTAGRAFNFVEIKSLADGRAKLAQSAIATMKSWSPISAASGSR